MKIRGVYFDSDDGTGGGGGGQPGEGGPGGQPQNQPGGQPSGGDGGGGQPGAQTPPQDLPRWYYDQLTDANREALRSKNWGGPNDMADSYLDLEKVVGAKGIIPPGENASQAELDKFYNELGRPETVEGYDLSGFEKPKDRNWDEGAEATMLGEMHKLGLNSQQVTGILNVYKAVEDGWMQEVADRAKETAAKSEAHLRKLWGAGYEQKFGQATEVLTALGSMKDVDAQALVAEIDAGGLGDRPNLAIALSGLADILTEDGTITIGGGGAAAMTPQEAAAELDKIENDERTRTILLDQNHPEHAALVKRRSRLYELKHAGQAR